MGLRTVQVLAAAAELRRRPRGLTVVTNDRLMAVECRQRGVTVMSCRDLRRLLAAAADSVPAADALSALSCAAGVDRPATARQFAASAKWPVRAAGKEAGELPVVVVGAATGAGAGRALDTALFSPRGGKARKAAKHKPAQIAATVPATLVGAAAAAAGQKGRCDLCGCKLKNLHNAVSHFKGKAHRRRLRAQTRALAAPLAATAGPRWPPCSPPPAAQASPEQSPPVAAGIQPLPHVLPPSGGHDFIGGSPGASGSGDGQGCKWAAQEGRCTQSAVQYRLQFDRYDGVQPRHTAAAAAAAKGGL